MWFKLPDGATEVSVALQNFKVEVKTELGNFFRAPEHFAAHLLAIPGFKVQEPEGTDIADLPQADPARDDALATLAAQVEALKLQVQDAHTEIQRITAANAALANERDQIKMAGADAAGKYIEVKAELELLKQKIYDKGINLDAPVEAPPPLATKKP